MKTIDSIESLKQLSNEDIEKFFETTTFRGVFSKRIRSKKNPDFYCGSIDRIIIEGKFSDLCPSFLNVPISCKLEEGLCEFNCKINLEVFREKEQYFTQVVARSLRNFTPDVDLQTKQSLVSKSIEERTEDLFERWGVDSCEFIGFYCEEDNQILIKDLHKVNFDRIPYYPDDEQRRPIVLKLPNRIPKIKLNDYYLFKWKLADKDPNRPFLIFCDFNVKPKTIEPKWFIEKLFSDRYEDKSKNFGSATNFLDTLSKQLSAKESTFVYELLQNANDYPCTKEKVDIEFHITDKYLLFMHSGDYFNIRNISGICGINEKEKADNKKAIGYKGIGFKTVFLNNHYVYLHTGDYSFRFDEKAERIKRIGAPWPILPIWTEEKELASEVINVFENSDKKFRVHLALRPNNPNILHRGKNCYESLFKEIFEDSNLILFVPNINSVKVFINGDNVRNCHKNVDNWLVREYDETIPLELQDLINKKIESGKSRIPEKYKDFTDTKVSFACKKEGSFLKPIENGLLYCYLPTSASWGFPFLMNTDMIPKGDRDDIEYEVKLNEDINFNSEISNIAGLKFFSWIKDLLESQEFNLGSIFSVIPDFDNCQKEHSEYYDDFIIKFRNGFESRLLSEAFIPVHQGFANIKNVICDKTGISATGIISDEAFYSAFRESQDAEKIFPLEYLRKSKDFKYFLNHYTDDSQKFEWDDLKEIIKKVSFTNWLKNQENNNRFISFLLSKKKIIDFIDKNIFLKKGGVLCAANELYFNIDEALADLKCFEDYLPHLSPETRKFFENNEDWNEQTDGIFKPFDAADFVDDELLNEVNFSSTTETLLKEKENTIHFIHFLAVNEISGDAYKRLPFFDSQNEIVENFDGLVLFDSTRGKEVKSMSWMNKDWIHFVSDDYFNIDRDQIVAFFTSLDVIDYTDEVIISRIILYEDYKPLINSKIEDWDTNLSFIKFVAQHDSLIKKGALNDFVLSVYNKVGVQSYQNDVELCFRSNLYETLEGKDWIDSDWMYSLDELYFDDRSHDDNIKLKDFFEKAFSVYDISIKLFYDYVVENHLSEIFKKISEENCNINFVHFISDNAKLIFEERKDEDKFEDMPVLDNNGVIVTPSDYKYNYAADDNAVITDIVRAKWFPGDLVLITSDKYIKLFGTYNDYISTFSKLGYQIFDNLNNFFAQVIVNELDGIRDNIESFEENVEFHDFVCSNVDSILPEHIKKLQKLPVFLYNGDEEPLLSDHSTGHYILSDRQSELFELFNDGIIPPTEIDTIDLHYKKSKKYWGDGYLNNTPFTLKSFIEWSTSDDHKETFIELLNEGSEKNVAFWRWIKKNYSKDEDIKAFSIFPIIALDNDGSEGYLETVNNSVYISDEYMATGKGIESMVSKYYNDVLLIAGIYLEDKTEDSKKLWKDFFEKLGIKTTIKELIFDTIIPNLASVEEESLPQLLSDPKYVDEIEDKWENLKSDLSKLKIKSLDGKFLEISDCIFVDLKIDLEPFKFLVISNEIDRTYFEDRSARKLLLKIAEFAESRQISAISEWRQEKLNQYLELQDNDEIEGIHYDFIKELAGIDFDDVMELEGIDKINLLSRDDDFEEPKNLTLGSVYKPIFDFEGYGIGEDELTFISDKYQSIDNNGQIRKLLWKALKVHSKFLESDIKLLANRTFALYFWQVYTLHPKVSKTELKEWIVNDKFSKKVCIPTKDSVKCAEDLYSRSIKDFVVQRTEDWENKLPSEKIPDGHEVLDLLDFKESLDFIDGLNALLSIKDSEKRYKILNWMLASYDEDSNSHEVSVYRDNSDALWRNGKHELIQIKELYAIDPKSLYLSQYLSQDSHIINDRLYFPADVTKTLNICSMLQIPVIVDADMQFSPKHCILRNDNLRKEFEFRLLIASGIANPKDCESLFNSYFENLHSIQFWECSSISLTYKENPDICQTSKKFYQDVDDFYYVKKWDNRQVFDEFVHKLQDKVGCKIEFDIFKNIFDGDESIELILQEYCQDALQNENFKSLLENYDPSIIDKVNIISAESEADEDVSGTYRPIFIKNPIDDDADDSDDINGNNPEESDEEDGESDEVDGESNEEDGESNEEDEEINLGEGDTSTNIHIRNNVIHSTNFPHRTDPPRNDDFSEDGNIINSIGDSENNFSVKAYKPSAPQPRTGPVTEWKKSREQAKLGVADVTPEELSAARDLIDGTKTNDEIIDEHYLARYRLYYALTQKGYIPEDNPKAFINSRNVDISTNNGYIYARSAKGGILFISAFLWNRILYQEGRLCMYYGNKACDFEIIDSIDQLIEYVGDDNIIIQIKGDDKKGTINSVFAGAITNTSAHVLIRIKSNERYNSLFAPIYNSNDDNDSEIN